MHVRMYVSAYDGPYDDSPESPESNMTKIKVLNVTPDSTKTEETDSDNDIPTIPTGQSDLCLVTLTPRVGSGG